jgi:phosphoribosylanthranilate isomerase
LIVVRVKICGISTVDAALAAAEAGANAIGLIFAPGRRQVTIPQAREIVAALPPFVSTVGVFVDEERPQIEEVVGACRLDFVQLHGNESPEFCAKMPVPVVKAIRVGDSSSLEQIRHYHVAAVLLEAAVPGIAGGSGRTFDWELATPVASTVRIILSGGLTPENVPRAISQVRPFAVDVSSGVETDGRKDPDKVRAFIGRVREWEWTHREPE